MRSTLDQTAFNFDGEDISWFEVIFWSVSALAAWSPGAALFGLLFLA